MCLCCARTADNLGVVLVVLGTRPSEPVVQLPTLNDPLGNEPDAVGLEFLDSGGRVLDVAADGLELVLGLEVGPVDRADGDDEDDGGGIEVGSEVGGGHALCLGRLSPRLSIRPSCLY